MGIPLVCRLPPHFGIGAGLVIDVLTTRKRKPTSKAKPARA
jgi:hypothetical protein